MDTTNQALINSEISLTLRLVHAEPVAYASSGDVFVDRVRLETPGDGHMDNVFALRDAYGADLVTLISDGVGGGNANLMTDLADPNNPNLAFSANFASGIGPGFLTLAHEVGHNLGGGHERGNPTQPAVGPFPYSVGYRFDVATPELTASYNDVLSCDIPLIQYANPAVTFNGVPTGKPSGDPLAADLALTFAQTGPVVAAYRPTVVADTAGPTAALFSHRRIGSSLEFTVRYTDASAVDPDTLDSADVLVSGPGGFSLPATLVSIDHPSVTGAYKFATYRVTLPATNPATDTLSFHLRPGAVADVFGEATAAGPVANHTAYYAGYSYAWAHPVGTLGDEATYAQFGALSASDPQNLYSFTLAQPRTVSARLLGLAANADLFIAAEHANIRDIAARVADYFSPFDVNVTTARPKAGKPRMLHVVIGGDGSWYATSSSGGVAMVNSFLLPRLPNQVFVFSDNLLDNRSVADAIAHEAGHSFGLAHQITPDGQIDVGSGQVGPIMGLSYFANRARWSRGPVEDGHQDSVRVLRGILGPSRDEAPDAVAARPTRAARSPGGAEIAGTIQTGTDVDLYTFTATAGAYRVSLVSGSMLDAEVVIYDSKGRAAAKLTSSSPAKDVPLASGNHRIRVRSKGGYANIGRYVIRLLTFPPAPVAPSASRVPGEIADFVELVWDYRSPRLGTTAFDVLRSADGGATFERVGRTDAGNTRFLDRGPLLPDHAYVYRLIASDRGSDSGPGAVSVPARTGPGLKFVMAEVGIELEGIAWGPHPTAVADFNEDGKADLLQDGGGVYLGRGDGSFEGPAPTGPLPARIGEWRRYLVGDVDADGHQDVVSFSTFSQSLVAYLGNGDGVFQVATHSSFPRALTLEGTLSTVLGDFTGDGRLDAFNGPDGLLFVGGAGELFAQVIAVDPHAGSGGARVADVDGDGRADLVWLRWGTGHPITVRIGHGDGTFAAAATYGSFIKQQSSFDATIGDLDGDGRDDVALSDEGWPDSTIHLFYGSASGQLELRGARGTEGDGDMGIADLDGDGDNDLIRLSNFLTNPAEVFTTGPAGVLSGRRPIAGDLTYAHQILFTGDFDHDGLDDLLVQRRSKTTSNLPWVLFNRTTI